MNNHINQFFTAAARAIGGIVGVIAGAMFGIMLLDFFVSDSPYDSTDAPPERSQMRLHTDHATGCQYLSVRIGGITPRLTASGQHMGCNHD